MPPIFIAYRREDAPGEAMSIKLALERLGQQVLLDVQVPPGMRWRDRIAAGLASADVFVALIGPRWLDVGEPFDDPNGALRVELEAALVRKDLLVLPVLVRGAHLPDPTSLPASLAVLLEREATSLRHESFDVDLRSIWEQIRRHRERRPGPDRPGRAEGPYSWRETGQRVSVNGGEAHFSEDGRTLAIPMSFALQLVDVEQGRRVVRFPDPRPGGGLRSVVFSPDGRRVAADAAPADQQPAMAWVWHRRHDEQQHHVAAENRDDAPASPPQFSSTGHYFVAPAVSSMVWDTVSWTPVWDDLDTRFRLATFGVSDEWVAFATPDAIEIRALPGSQYGAPEIAGDVSSVRDIQAHPSDRGVLLSVAEGVVELHRQNGPTTRIQLQSDWRNVDARFSPGGAFVVIGWDGDSGTRHHLIHDAITGDRLDVPRFAQHRISVDDRELVILAAGAVLVVDLREQEEREVELPYDETARGEQRLLGLSADASHIAITPRRTWTEGPPSAVLRLVALRSSRPADPLDFPAIWAAFSPTEPRVAALAQDEVRFYDWAPGG